MINTYWRFLAVICLLWPWCASTRADDAKPPAKPNIILILADDLGYGDLGCYGQKLIRTPHLDEMARRGMRMTDHYAGSTVCAPSRCTLMLGRHTGHIPVRGNAAVLMDEKELTVAEVLRDAGYATAAIGKWGVGHPPPPGDPARHGFQEFFGYLDMFHAHNYFPDFLWHNGNKIPVKGNVVKVINRGGVALKRSQYSHDLFTDRALRYIEQHQKDPFFLYLPFTIPHANNEAGDEGMEVPSPGAYVDSGWPTPQINHAAMISRLDESVGRILALLEKLKIHENTLVIFTSDNGPHKEGGADPAFFQSAGPLRGYKRDLYEGGIRVPCIAYWPGTITAGQTCSHVGAFWDFFPTACEVAGVDVPEGLDGISYLPALLGHDKQQQKHPYLYWEFHEKGSQQAVRMGDWKAIRPVGGNLELYNLKTDVAETENVAEQHPDVVALIEKYLKSARTESQHFPLKPTLSQQHSAPAADRFFVDPKVRAPSWNGRWVEKYHTVTQRSTRSGKIITTYTYFLVPKPCEGTPPQESNSRKSR